MSKGSTNAHSFPGLANYSLSHVLLNITDEKDDWRRNLDGEKYFNGQNTFKFKSIMYGTKVNHVMKCTHLNSMLTVALFAVNSRGSTTTVQSFEGTHYYYSRTFLIRTLPDQRKKIR